MQLGVRPMWKRGHRPRDLKDQPGVLGTLFGSLPSAKECSRYAVSVQVLKQFQEKGWLVSPRPVLTRPQIDMLQQEVSALISYDEEEAPPNKDLLYSCTEINPLSKHQIFHSMGQWRVSRSLHDLIYLPPITVVASQLLGNIPLQFLHDELFCKPPKTGSCVVWHQNGIQWQNTYPLHHITVHIALDYHTDKNGGLQVVSGSHAWRPLGQMIPMSVPADPDPAVQMSAIQASLLPQERELFAANKVCPGIPPGHALFMHPSLLHGSEPNTSDGWRRSAVVHYCAFGTTAVANGPLFNGTYVMKAGEALKGEFYPVVFTPAGARPIAS